MTFTLTPQVGYRVKEVLVDGINNEAAIESESYTFEDIVSSHTIVVKFEKQDFVIMASVETAGGTIAPAGASVITYNGSKAYTITAQTGYMIDKVLIDGINDDKAVSSGKYTFSNVTDNHTIVAHFKLRTYDITATQGANGTVTPEGITAVNYGASITYTITPNAGYMIKTVTVDGKSNAAAVASGTYTFTNVTAKHTIAATFALLNTIQAEGDALGEIVIYPNPTSGELKIENGELKIENIEIYNITGQKITFNFQLSTFNSIDISDLPTGIYFLRIQTENGTVVRKVIKN